MIRAMNRTGLRAAALLAAVTARTAGQDPVRSHEQMHALHRDTKAYIAMLEDPRRDAYQKPSEVVRALALRPGETVADVGSGSGYFTLRFAEAVGAGGRVYAVDVDPEMVRHLNRRLRDAGVRNVQTVLAEPDDPLLPDASVDRFVVVDTWHHIDKRPAYLALMKRMLKPGGQVVMIDYQKRALPVGPPLEIKIAREDLVAEMAAAGYRLAREHTFLPYQYFLVFSPAS
jgi:ubiquinone/menaquinone biosynthesis C-methylase UbiE